MTPVRVAAVDLGASSGRVVAAEVGPDLLTVTEVARFPNGPVRLGATLHWDVLALYRAVLDGLGAGRAIDAVGIDAWAVDHGLLDATGALLGNPVHYRDSRTDGVADRVHAVVPAADLYATTGVQVLPFNTIYQLAAAAGTPQLTAANDLLLVPDLLGYWLTGERRAEVTNASTTGLLDVRKRDWSSDVMRRAGIDPGLFAPLVEPGERIGELAPHVLADTGLPASVPLVAVGSHDTASAVVGVPAEGERFAYVSCGTWSLVGVELAEPVLTEASRAANFSNELGVDGTVRYLRNVMGLWLLQECLRDWPDAQLADLLAEAAQVPAFTAVVDADDPVFLPPGDMPARIAAACRGSGRNRRPTGRPPSGACSTASPSPTGVPCATPYGSPAARSTSCTLSEAAPATRCSAGSPPTPAGCRSWPARSRRPRWATRWCRPERWGRWKAVSRSCGRCCAPPTR